MDSYDYEQIDKRMTERLDEIYRNPQKHKFYSCFDAFSLEDRRGPRGGKIKGLKGICYHCGNKKNGHAEKTEEL